MTDERQTPNAAPSPTDGESTDNQASEGDTAVAVAPPPDDGATKAEDPPSAETKAEEPKADEPKAEESKAEESKAEESKADEPKAEGSKAEKSEAAAEEDSDPARASDAPETPEASADDGSEEAEPVSAASAAKGEGEAAKTEPADDEPAAATAESEAEEPKAADAEGTGGAEAEAKAEEPEAEAKAEAKAEEAAKPTAEAKATGKAEKTEKTKEAAKAAKAEKAEKAEKTKEAAKAEKAAAEDDGKAKEEKDAKAELDDPALKELRKAKEEGTVVQGKVIGWNRGGFHVVIDEVTAFCPSSEMELGRPKSPNAYVDREMDFKVVKFQRKGRRVVLSRSDLLKKKRGELLEGLSKGTVAKGIVTSLPDFGAFVDLGGIEGLVHVSELSRQRVAKPTDMLELGQQVEVKVLKIEKGGDRISLSMKALEPNPWDDVAKKYPRGTEFEGKVLRKADFGLFVELEPDVEGLIHVSQFPPGKSIDSDDVQPGNTVQGWVREVEPKRERISLSLREVPEDDPWKTVTETFPEGEMVEGTVESIAPFGVFINLAPGLTGLLPNSETGLPRGASPARVYHPGQTTEVQVLSIDTRRKRISLGQKGSRVEATKADLQEYKQQQKQQEDAVASGAMAAAFARLKGDLDLPGDEADAD